MKLHIAVVLVGLNFILVTQSVAATSSSITPIQALSTQQFDKLSSYKQFSEGNVQGAGSALRIAYQSSISLHSYIAILDENGSYNPADLWYFVLPAAQSGTEQIIDLSAMTTWSAGQHSYVLMFLSNAEQTDTVFSNMFFEGGGILDVAVAGVRHFFHPEPYWVSTPHFLRGYSVLGISLSFLLSAITLVLFALCMRQQRYSLAFALLLFSLLTYQARVGLDLAKHTVKHLSSWFASHSYAEAADTYIAAEAVREDARRKQIARPHVSICFGSTDYYPKLFRYLLYPITVDMTGTLQKKTTHVLLIRDLNNTFENGVLRCGSMEHRAEKIRSFEDGTILFSLASS